MEELTTLFGGFARLVLIVGGGISVIAFAFAGFSFLTAQGDPGKLARAKAGVIGVVVGLAVMAMAFIIPNVISETVIEPVGGVALQVEAGVDCDRILKQQLVFQRNVANRHHINRLISDIQAKRKECAPEWWDPNAPIYPEYLPTTLRVKNDAHHTQSERYTSNCFPYEHLANSAEENEPLDAANADARDIGDLEVPAGLRIEGNLEMAPQRGSGRDRHNNIIVYWSLFTEKRPWDGARCWLYLSKPGVWSANYLEGE